MAKLMSSVVPAIAARSTAAAVDREETGRTRRRQAWTLELLPIAIVLEGESGLRATGGAAPGGGRRSHTALPAAVGAASLERPRRRRNGHGRRAFVELEEATRSSIALAWCSSALAAAAFCSTSAEFCWVTSSIWASAC